jgi:hypothetical protein
VIRQAMGKVVTNLAHYTRRGRDYDVARRLALEGGRRLG